MENKMYSMIPFSIFSPKQREKRQERKTPIHSTKAYIWNVERW